MAAVLLAMVFALMVLLRIRDDAAERIAAANAGAPSAATGVAEPAPQATESSARELDVPIELDPGASGLVLALGVRKSQLVTYVDGSSFFTLNGVMENRGASELDELGVAPELLD